MGTQRSADRSGDDSMTMKRNHREDVVVGRLELDPHTQTPANEWVYSLLEHMLRDHIEGLTLSRMHNHPVQTGVSDGVWESRAGGQR